MNSKTKKFLIGSLVVLAGLVFAFNIPSALAAGGCEENNGNFQMVSLSSIFNPLLDFAEKAAKGFGYEVSLAAAPDPDFCGSDSVACDGSTPTATISWVAAPTDSPGICEPGRFDCNNLCRPFCYYILTIPGVGTYQTSNTSYLVSSGLSNNTTYNWSVEAYYVDYACIVTIPSASCPLFDQPYGSFTTPIALLRPL